MVKKVKNQSALIREIPHSIEAEQAVIGGLMLDNQTWDKVCDRITENDFYRHDHKLLFAAIERLAHQNKPFDLITLKENLKDNGQLENAGGEFYLFELAKNTPSAANIGAYAHIVREKSMLRQLNRQCSEIIESTYEQEGRGASEILDEAEQRVLSIGEQITRGKGVEKISLVIDRTMQQVEELIKNKGALKGTPCGFTDLDKLTQGLQKSDMIVVAARPSMGKTSFAMNIAEHVAIKEKKPVLIFSLEMSSDQLAMRMKSSLGRIDNTKIQSGNLDDRDCEKLFSVSSAISNAPIFIDDQGGLTPQELRARARRVAKQTNGELSLIIIDYLQLMRVPGYKDNKVAEISEISRTIKALAKELNIPIIALSQLNRSLEQRADKRPLMSDLRESGAIEQDADLIVFIYRDEVYNESTQDRGIAEIILSKHRNGATGKIKLTFLGKFSRFENYLPTSY